jgi:hypothetical protein
MIQLGIDGQQLRLSQELSPINLLFFCEKPIESQMKQNRKKN